MKTKIAYTFLPLVLLMLVLGCSKKEDAVDPRDQYVGTYSITGAGTLKNNSTGSSFLVPLSGESLVVKKGAASDELTFTDNETYTVKLSGSTFTIPSYKSTVDFGSGYVVTFNVTGSGSFSGKTISYTDSGIGTGTYTYLNITGSYTGPRP